MIRLSMIGISLGIILIGAGAYSLVSSPGKFAQAADLIVAGAILLLVPAGISDLMERRRIRAIESRLPDFLMDVAEASKFGTNLADSILSVSGGEYGMLGTEVKKMAAQLKWGILVDEVLRGFSQRNNSPFISKLIDTVIESNRSGGSIGEVISLIGLNARESQLLQREKYSQLRSYVIILVTAYVVFLLTVIILGTQFFPKMQEQLLLTTASQSQFVSQTAVQIIKEIFTGVVIVQGVGSGFMSGILTDGRYRSGLLYAATFLGVGYGMLLLFGVI